MSLAFDGPLDDFQTFTNQRTVGPDAAEVAAAETARRGFGKRVFDVVFSATLLVFSAPLWIAIALAIRLDSPGPVFYAQERVGLNGRRFRLYKFRSMQRDAEARLSALLVLNEVDGPVFKMRRDPRITRVGAFLRRTSLDELPQLLNILRGEMSVVGPRPPIPAEVAQYRPADRIRLTVKPGLTCLWQISGRSDCSFDRWMELDRDYIRRQSLLLDLAIVARTAMVVIFARGAY